MSELKIELKSVQSSQIAAVGYHPESKTLAIQFKSGGLYHYANVAPEDHAALLGAGKPKEKHSIGSHFYRHIKPYADKFPFTKQASK